MQRIRRSILRFAASFHSPRRRLFIDGEPYILPDAVDRASDVQAWSASRGISLRWIALKGEGWCASVQPKYVRRIAA